MIRYSQWMSYSDDDTRIACTELLKLMAEQPFYFTVFFISVCVSVVY